MIKGIYKSASGMIPRIKKQEMIANNISNANTAGFKKDMLFTQELSKAQTKRLPRTSDWEQPMVERTYTDFLGGSFDKTGNPLNLAIDGDGFFQIQLDDGTTVLTRSGSFEVNKDGLLAFPGGGVLLAEGGAIEVGNGKVTVSITGEVEVDGSTAGKITPVTVSDLTVLEKIGASSFLLPDGAQTLEVDQATIRQGYLESSNVDIVREMIDMIITYRTYEANAKALQTQDESLGNLMQRVGSNR